MRIKRWREETNQNEVVATLESIGGRKLGTTWAKENVLTTDRGNADWAEIRHRAHLSRAYLRVWKKSTTADLGRAHEMRRYILSINGQQTSSFGASLSNCSRVSHFSLCVFIRSIRNKIEKETRNFALSHNDGLSERTNCAFLCTEILLGKRKEIKTFRFN